MDITETLTPKSDQLNAEDLLAGPRTVTVEKVTAGSVEQPVDVHLTEFPGRPFRPSKTVRRILVAAWGAEASGWTGRRMTIYRDPEIKFGGDKVGGIRISSLSHIDKPLTISLTETRGKRKPHRIDPLPAGPAPFTPEKVAEFERRITDAATIDELDAVARDLKACDLGGHRKALLAAWSDRQAAIKSEPVPTQTSTEATLVTDEQIQDLAMAREQTYGKTAKAQQDWAAWVNDTIGRDVDMDRNLTRDEADDLLALLAAKDAQ